MPRVHWLNTDAAIAVAVVTIVETNVFCNDSSEMSSSVYTAPICRRTLQPHAMNELIIGIDQKHIQMKMECSPYSNNAIWRVFHSAQ